MKGEYWTCPTISDEGYDILVTGRADIEKFRTNPRFSIRVTITWKYGGHDMPGIEDSKLMEQATDAMADTFDKDPVAVLTGIYTGDGSRQWVFLHHQHQYLRTQTQRSPGAAAADATGNHMRERPRLGRIRRNGHRQPHRRLTAATTDSYTQYDC
jgi:hypothetical protein